MPETQEMTLPVVDLARENDEFRKVLWTGDKTQLVLMAIPEGDEVHLRHDQHLYFVAGTDLARIGDVETNIADGDVRIVPSGVFHNFRNTESGMLKLFTTYSPPEHERGAQYATKAEAVADELAFYRQP
jgi:mannose-6-phosphate isomerase-like protein (cupin superfamily)